MKLSLEILSFLVLLLALAVTFIVEEITLINRAVFIEEGAFALS